MFRDINEYFTQKHPHVQKIRNNCFGIKYHNAILPDAEIRKPDFIEKIIKTKLNTLIYFTYMYLAIYVCFIRFTYYVSLVIMHLFLMSVPEIPMYTYIFFEFCAPDFYF